MENTESTIMASDIAKTIGTMTERTIKALNEGTEVRQDDVRPFDLVQYQEAFREVGGEILPDSLADARLDALKNDLYKLKNRFPEGTRVTLAAFPCDANGRIYSDAEMKNHDYFKTLFVNEKTGLSSGYGSWGSGLHSKLLPKEVQDKCSFTVHYASTTPFPDDKDFEQFAIQYKTAYRALKELLA